MLAFKWYPDRLREKSVAAYIDNMGVLHSIINGASKSRDQGTLVHAYSLKIVQLKSQLWLEHVQSASNVTDGGSREGITDPVAKALGVVLSDVTPFVSPFSFPRLSPAEAELIWRL